MLRLLVPLLLVAASLPTISPFSPATLRPSTPSPLSPSFPKSLSPFSLPSVPSLSTTLLLAKPRGAKEATDGSASFRQLSGVKGGSVSDNIWAIRLQLTKPVTWIPLVWGVMCGAAASGNYHWIWNPFDPADRDVALGLTDAAKGFTAMLLAGPFLTGFTQTINDWYDRDIDAINEPNRPIPSGAISEGQVKAQIGALLVGGLGLAYGLDVWTEHEFPSVFCLAVFGSFISYIYSAPPLKLKMNGWTGSFALGASYISLPWWCGQAVFGELDRPVYVPRPPGDRELGLNSLPVAFGIDGAAKLCAGSISATQLGVAAYIASIGETNYALLLAALLVPQVYLQATVLLPDPVGNDVKFQASSQPFFVFGILATALAVGHHEFAGATLW
ncbi:hypothetical protein TeGR_g7740 [Tetraparma gracilis]|uniref:Chlorophyll synthase n=1 Tax=Tetraparma gracilis TaxID=2962635 RepID=A0ABQ6N6V7_9STRA|nr:hypothetical protein TeGR_g7740 [Tetraparma gracilis]